MRTTSGTAQLTRARLLKPNRRARARAAFGRRLHGLGVGLLAILLAPVVLSRWLGSRVAAGSRAVQVAALRLLRALASGAAGLAHAVGGGGAGMARPLANGASALGRAPDAAGGILRTGLTLAVRPIQAAAVRSMQAWDGARMSLARLRTKQPKSADAAVPMPIPPAPLDRPAPLGPRRLAATGQATPPTPQVPALRRLKLPALPRFAAPTLQLSPRPREAQAPAPAPAATVAAATARRRVKDRPASKQRAAESKPRGFRALLMAVDESSPVSQRVGVFIGLVALLVLLGSASIGAARLAFGGGSGAPGGHSRLGQAPSEGPAPGILGFIGIVPSPSPSATNPTPAPARSPSASPTTRPPGSPRPPSPTPTAQQPPSPAQSTVAASPTTLVADGVMSSTILVTLKDGSGNLVRGDRVTLASNRGPQDSIAPFSAGSDNTDSAGVARFRVTSTRAGSAMLTAADTTVTPNVTVAQTATLTFLPGQTSASVSTVAAAPAGVPANGSASSTITVTLKDAFGNLISGHQVSIATTRPGSDNITAVSSMTNPSGVATFTINSVISGATKASATDTTAGVAVSQTADVTFSQAAHAGNSTVVADLSSLPADGVSAATITVTIVDFAGQPIAGHEVSITSSRGAQDTITTVVSTTDATGAATFQVVSSIAGTSTLTATDVTAAVTVTQTATVAFTAV